MKPINVLTGEKDKNINNGVIFNEIYNQEREFSLSIAKENLRDILSVLNKFGITHWLMFGTLLGCVREGNFIEYDTDIDLGCFRCQYNLLAYAIKELESLGFQLIRVVKNNSLVTIIRDGVYLDFYTFIPGKEDESEYFWSQVKLTKINLKLIERKFLGFEVNILTDCSEVLSKWYGTDWRVPKKGISPNNC